ncbi:isopentenyl-diphosphate Delta-isomerase [Myceligenerans salitolerans]|uniref:Isopentenyl-diphosphate Delta-isomerase n=1 Tax=Myceligenerans salitolerans TaxID=1230528 RepID=A0ABS3I489_9MICO|nr:isopentenyl-diphosphate Delta-isomerase [Myceligenerans salitolerans]MBO0607810.1 isopentenyl-diphosphate Delta-isomerase [Myceligenerans salitolerans]
MVTEKVVLVDEDGTPIGTELKATVHSARTPLHLAFSCHVLDPAGQVLATRRSLGKRTWPGVWTNSFCGHPQPGEPMEDAVVRRARDELGLRIRDLRVVLPRFRYRAVDAAGVVENEFCPVYEAVTDEGPRPNPDEVAEIAWPAPAALGAALRGAPWAFSPWFVQQAREMSLYAAPGDDGRGGVVSR